MDTRRFLEDVPELSDLELAVLLSLVAQQHCLITTDDEVLDDLATELALIVSEVFNLSFSVVSQEDQCSVDRFGEAILSQSTVREAYSSKDDSGSQLAIPQSLLADVDIRAGSQSEPQDLDTRAVVNVIIAKEFNHAPRDVQVAALELMKRRRIFGRTAVHPVPKVFLFLPLTSASSKNVPLHKHLKDHIFISHYHDPQDGFANLEDLDSFTVPEQRSGYTDDTSAASDLPRTNRKISLKVINELRVMGNAVNITPEIRRYIQDIVVFMRMNRAIDGGITPIATTMFTTLAKCLAPLHNINFVTPDLVGLAVRKVYLHRIVIVSPERERSMQYGSNLYAVETMLHGLTPQDVIEDVLTAVQSPV